MRQLLCRALFAAALAWATAPPATAADAAATTTTTAPPTADPWAARVAALGTATGPDLDALQKELLAGGMPAHAALESGPEATAPLRAQLRLQIRTARDTAARAAGLVVHEWGPAMTYRQGIADGKIDAGDDAADLPEFAQVWSRLAKQREANGENPPGGPGVKIEIIRKPIVYFYSPKPDTVTFKVYCPRGRFSAWAPKATHVSPDPADPDPAASTDGAALEWRNIDLRPAPPAANAPPAPATAYPPVPPSAWWWPICRDTDSTPLTINGTTDKFLFYRGTVADAPSALAVDGGAGQKYTLTNTLKREPVRRILVLNVAGPAVHYRTLGPIPPKQKVVVEMATTAAGVQTATAAQMRDRLAELLESEGLFPKEAAGMARIWEKEWARTDGVRVIYFNPPGATSSLLPVVIEPRPAQVVRTLLVAVECLSDSRQNVVSRLIEQLGDGAYARRQAAQRQLIQLGPAAEQPLRDALEKCQDEEIRSRINGILRQLDPASHEPPPPPPPTIDIDQ